jgi:hypothetical protein
MDGSEQDWMVLTHNRISQGRTGWVWTGLDEAQTEQGIGLDAWVWTGLDGFMDRTGWARTGLN